MDRPRSVEVGQDHLEYGSSPRRSGGEVLVERHGGRALVALVVPPEPAPAVGAGPGLPPLDLLHHDPCFTMTLLHHDSGAHSSCATALEAPSSSTPAWALRPQAESTSS